MARAIASGVRDFCRHSIKAAAVATSVMSLPSSVAVTPGEMSVERMSSCFCRNPSVIARRHICPSRMDECSPARYGLVRGEEDGDAFVHHASMRSADRSVSFDSVARPVFSHDDLDAGRLLFNFVVPDRLSPIPVWRGASRQAAEARICRRDRQALGRRTWRYDSASSGAAVRSNRRQERETAA